MRIDGSYKLFGVGRINLFREFGADISNPVPLVWESDEDLGVVALDSISQSAVIAKSPRNQPLQYTLVSGTLPGGITLGSDGLLAGTFLAAGIRAFTIRASDGISSIERTFSLIVNTPPVWLRGGRIAEVSQGEVLSDTLTATTHNERIAYSKVEEDAFPETFMVAAEDFGVLVEGYFTTQDQFAPRWISAGGALGSVSKGVSAAYSLVAEPADEREIVSYGIVGDGILPSGYVLSANAGTATISGVTGLYPQDAIAVPSSPEPEPIWSTAAGPIAAANTTGDNAVSVQFVAAPQLGSTITYAMQAGDPLPFGLSLTPSGLLSGSLSPLGAVERRTGPVWNTPAGSLGAAQNGSTVSIGLSAAPTEALIEFGIVEGILPLGLTLATTGPTTGFGTISGTLNASFTDGALSAAREFIFTIRATSSLGGYSDQTFSYIVNP